MILESLASSIIRKAFQKFGNDVAVSCSFGKDSLLVLDLARRVNPDVKVLFCNTRNEFKETIDLKRKLEKDWDLNMIETIPWKDWTWVKIARKYGLPKIRLKGTHYPRCCYYLKDKPAIEAVKSQGIKCLLTGLTSFESRSRFLTMKRMEGCGLSKDSIHFNSYMWFTKGWNCWKFNPIALMKPSQVWDLTYRRGIPINEVYTKWNCVYKRVGCLMCTAYKFWEEKLSISHPKVFEFLKTF